MSYDPPSTVQSVCHKEPVCRNRDIPTKAFLRPIIQLSPLHCNPLTTSCVFCSNWLKFGLRDQKLFTTFTWGLYQESASLQQNTQGKFDLVYSLGRWTGGLVYGWFRNWCLGLFMSHWIGIRTPVWAILTKAWLTIGWRASLLSPKASQLWEETHLSLDQRFAVTESPLLQEGTLKTLNMKTSLQDLQKFSREILLHFLTIVVTTEKLSLALLTTSPASSQSKKGLVLINPLISTLKYPGSIICLQSLCFWLTTCGFSYWHVHSEEWSSQFPLLNFLIRGNIESLVLGEGRGADFLCLYCGMM